MSLTSSAADEQSHRNRIGLRQYLEEVDASSMRLSLKRSYNGLSDSADDTLVAWVRSVHRKEALPEITWDWKATAHKLVVRSNFQPTKIEVCRSTSNIHDFRESQWSCEVNIEKPVSNAPFTYEVPTQQDMKKYQAVFVKLSYAREKVYQGTYTTDLFVVPPSLHSAADEFTNSRS